MASTKKVDVISRAPPTSVIFSFGGFSNYAFINNHADFANLIQDTRPQERLFFEYISGTQPVNLFFDIDCPSVSEQANSILEDLHQEVLYEFPVQSRIVLSSHSSTKLSFHVLYRLKNEQGKQIYFRNVSSVAKFYDQHHLERFKHEGKSIIDRVVYRDKGGLFRTYLSNKVRGENRPVIKAPMSDEFTVEETFVAYCPEIENAMFYKPKSVQVENTQKERRVSSTRTIQEDFTPGDELKEKLKKMIEKEWGKIDGVVYLYKREENLIVEFRAERCVYAKSKHHSNNQYVEFSHWGVRYKCHSSRCAKAKNKSIRFRDLSRTVKNAIRETFGYNSTTGKTRKKKYNPFENENEVSEEDEDEDEEEETNRKNRRIETITQEELMETASDYIRASFDSRATDPMYSPKSKKFSMNVSEDSSIQLPRPAEHILSTLGYTIDSPVGRLHVDTTSNPIPAQISNFFQFNLTTNIVNNNYNCEEQEITEVKIEPSLFEEEKTNLWNNALNSLTEMALAELFVYSTKNVGFSMNGICFVFVNGLWREDLEHMLAIKELVDLIRLDAQKITVAGTEDEESYDALKKRLSRIQRMTETHNSARNTLRNCASCSVKIDFDTLLNSSTHLIPFTNGVWDLDTKTFRKTKPEDYVVHTVGYSFDETASNDELSAFIETTIPDEEKRRYMLKRCSDCLDTRISNDTFMFLTGNGANGKSAFLALMSETFGELATTLRPRVFTGKEADSSSAQPDIAKLEGKRFASLVEEDSGSSQFNVGLFKRLTGGDKVSTRKLRQHEKDIYMRTKFFYACNSMPEFPTSEQALWRRIRVVEFDQTFSEVERPGVHLADKKLVFKIMSDLTWRQTFVNMLINMSTVEVEEPDCVKTSTINYKQGSDEIGIWLTGRIVRVDTNILTATDVVKAHTGSDLNLKGYQARPYNIAITQHLTDTFGNGITRYENKVHKIGKKSVRGWKGFALNLIEDE